MNHLTRCIQCNYGYHYDEIAVDYWTIALCICIWCDAGIYFDDDVIYYDD